jgi:UDP-N-acetylglucosamine 2-epimerase (non-hydrolysing)
MSIVLHVVGARPNFVKMAPVIRAVEAQGGVDQYIVHTGQHYDARLSQDIMQDLDFPEPDIHLDIGSGTHAEQTGRTMMAIERLLRRVSPALVVVAGDVNATLAAALAAAKLQIPVAHVESGLRSFDWSMPEEINRVLTDRLSQLLFTHSPEAEQNLLAEGISNDRIHYVGNTMVDSLHEIREVAAERRYWERYALPERKYVLVTLHRPSNVDDAGRLARIVGALTAISSRAPVVFPVHPRTERRLADVGHYASGRSRVLFTDPVGYIDFVSLELGAAAVITDSGGVQEETSALGVECYTLRSNTERPITVSSGTNHILGDDPEAIEQIPVDTISERCRVSIPLWDGMAATRAAPILARAVGEVAAQIVFA